MSWLLDITKKFITKNYLNNCMYLPNSSKQARCNTVKFKQSIAGFIYI